MKGQRFDINDAFIQEVSSALDENKPPINDLKREPIKQSNNRAALGHARTGNAASSGRCSRAR